MSTDRLERRRYKKVSSRVWGDDKFKSLSAPAPNAQTLWFYLMFGPQTSVIPGLSVAGEASLSEGLGWTPAAFRKCYAEIADQGMAIADWGSRVIWLPNAPHYNEPESPNVVKNWVKVLDEVPDCDLKWMAVEGLRTFLGGLSEAFTQAFDEALIRFRIRVPRTVDPGTRGNQYRSSSRNKTETEGVSMLTPPSEEIGTRAAAFMERYPRLYQQYRNGARYLPRPALDYDYSIRLVTVWPDDELDRIAVFFLTTDHQFAKSGSRTIGQLCALASWCDDQIRNGKNGPAANKRPKGCRHNPPCVDDAAHTTRYLAEAQSGEAVQ